MNLIPLSNGRARTRLEASLVPASATIPSFMSHGRAVITAKVVEDLDVTFEIGRNGTIFRERLEAHNAFVVDTFHHGETYTYIARWSTEQDRWIGATMIDRLASVAPAA